MPTGKTTITFENGNKLLAEFKDGNPINHFTLTYANGDEYIGELVGGSTPTPEPHGQGMMTKNINNIKDVNKADALVLVHDGQWKDGVPEGNGKETYADGSFYEGQFMEGLATGTGRKIYADGTIYEGDWQDGVRQGYGKFTYPSGTQYVGQFEDDDFSGSGTYTVYSDGKITYQVGGLWKEGKYLE
jgi:hypothetical protein